MTSTEEPDTKAAAPVKLEPVELLDSKESSPPLKKQKTSISPTPQPIPQVDVKQSKKPTTINKPIEEIIDGSELRKFLNRNLTPYLVKGLNEMSVRWEENKFEGKDTKEVLETFSEIIKSYAQ